MYNYEFSCQRYFLDLIKNKLKRNILVANYCTSNFRTISLVDFYYRKIDENAILSFFIIAFFLPALIASISYITKKLLTPLIKKIKNDFQMTSVLASFTLMSFTSMSVVLLNAENDFQGEVYFKISELLGTYFFNSIVIIGTIVYFSKKEIVLPKIPIIKDLAFVVFSILLVCAFALNIEIGYFSVFMFFALYVGYLFCSFYVEKAYRLESMDLEQIDQQKLNLEVIKEDIIGENREHSDSIDSLKKQSNLIETIQKKDLVDLEKSQTEKKDMEFDFGNDFPPEDDENNEDENESDQKKDISSQFFKIFDGIDFSSYSYLDYLVKLPIDLAAIFLIPLKDNPLMQTSLKFVVLGNSLTFTFFALKLIDFSISWFFGMTFSITLVFYILNKIGLSDKFFEIICDISSIVACLSAIDAYTLLITDVIYFICFYFSITTIFSNLVFSPIANSISQFFIHMYLCTIGETQLSVMSGFSISTFQFIAAMIFTLFYRVRLGLYDFDLLLIGKFKKRLSGSSEEMSEKLLVRSLLPLVLCEVLLVLFYLNQTGFKLNRNFIGYAIMFYGVFVVYSFVNSY